MQGFRNGVLLGNPQNDDFAFITPPGPALPDGKTLPFPRLGTLSETDTHAPQRQNPHHAAAFLQNARKGHDRLAPAAQRGHPRRQARPFHKAARLFGHIQRELPARHILRIHRIASADHRPHKAP